MALPPGDFSVLNVASAGTSGLTGNVTVGTTAAGAALLVNGTVTATGTSALRGAVTVGTTAAPASVTVIGPVTLSGTASALGIGGSLDVTGVLVAQNGGTIYGTLILQTAGYGILNGTSLIAASVVVASTNTLTAATATFGAPAVFNSATATTMQSGLNVVGSVSLTGTAGLSSPFGTFNGFAATRAIPIAASSLDGEGYSSIRQSGTTSTDSWAEYGGAFGLVVNKAKNKVGLYAGALVVTGGNAAWSLNTVAQLSSTLADPKTGSFAVQGYEPHHPSVSSCSA